MQYQHTDTDLPIESEYPKLIRDRIPQVVYRNDGSRVPHRTAIDKAEYIALLKKKVIEESEELAAAEIKIHITEEIADLQELIDALVKAVGVTPDDVQAVRADKRTKRGGFDQRLIMTGPTEQE
jgi:predicted house-cleaning noncanonical NTP pyrophosphatase (MazG superfamily)